MHALSYALHSIALSYTSVLSLICHREGVHAMIAVMPMAEYERIQVSKIRSPTPSGGSSKHEQKIPERSAGAKMQRSYFGKETCWQF